jgi:hypothetical protein
MVITKVSIQDVQKEVLRIGKGPFCSYCGAEIKGEVEFAIHRDGFGIGPEVPLCVKCGSSQLPTCAEIWEKIAKE